METLLAMAVTFLVTAILVRSNYRAHVEDLRSAVAFERKRRLQDETLSKALFDRTKTRQRDTEMPN